MPRFSENLFMSVLADSTASHAFIDDEVIPFSVNLSPAISILDTLVLRVARKPKDLLAHLRRIYFCYHNALPESLYAALLDLLIILDQKGKDLSRRLILGSRSMLDAEQLAFLISVIQGPQPVKGNRFSLFTKGLVGVSQLIEVDQQPAELQYDYLGLAYDFIEYSQLEEAMAILEQGLEKSPDRQDLQTLLLELYKSTQNNERFQHCYDRMIKFGKPLINEWALLAVFFNGKIS